MKNNLERLSRHLGYPFKNPALLRQALTHCSAGIENYERFEFLGDSILSFVIANELFNLFPSQSEGQLSRLRSFLVKGEMLAEIAREISLGDYLFLGQGELKSGGFRRDSILADSLEALFAAVFLDGGIESAQQVILQLYRSRLNTTSLNDGMKDYKTQLQEHLQSIKKPLPEYSLAHIEGEDCQQIFHVSCQVAGMKIKAAGEGSSRRKAEQFAAQSFLKQLKLMK